MKMLTRSWVRGWTHCVRTRRTGRRRTAARARRRTGRTATNSASHPRRRWVRRIGRKRRVRRKRRERGIGRVRVTTTAAIVVVVVIVVVAVAIAAAIAVMVMMVMMPPHVGLLVESRKSGHPWGRGTKRETEQALSAAGPPLTALILRCPSS